MKQFMKPVQAMVLCVIAVLVLSGCETVHKAKIQMDLTSQMPGGLVVTNFSMEEVDTFVRYFIEQKGYEIKFADSSDKVIQEELADEDSSLLWLAQKPGEPTILYITTSKSLIVTFVKVSGLLPPSDLSDYSNILYRILKEKFGEENVHLIN